MPQYSVRMSTKGQVTIPAKIRDHFDLKEGDKLDFYIDAASHSVRILARNKRLADLAGILKVGSDIQPISQEAMDDAIGDFLSEKHRRISNEWNEWREFQKWRATRDRVAVQ